MHTFFPSFVLGFHGCDKAVGEKIPAGDDGFKQSESKYDWLGNGVYFWENDPARALDYAKHIKNSPGRSSSTIRDPFVIGAIIDLGHCLNLLQFDHLQVVKQGYESLKQLFQSIGEPLPKNKAIEEDGDLLLRPLDCAVIQLVHALNEKSKDPSFDTVRGVFWEGSPLYPQAGFKEKNHIQICVRTPKSIKGLFRPLDPKEGLLFK